MVDKKRAILEPAEETGSLKFLYGNPLGRMLLKLLVNPAVSKLGGAFMNSFLSKRMIGRFIEQNQIDISRYEEGPFRCYNDFFCRKMREGLFSFDASLESLISPCDAKLSAYKISRGSRFSIKGSSYSVEELLCSRELAAAYEGGTCLIFRLTVDDYHRYCYVDSGTKGQNIYIKGKLHTVQPVALKQHNIYKENCREYTVMQTDHLGTITQIEVGALMVGKIKNLHQEYRFSKGEEKGMFLFGGSTIVLLMEEGKVRLDQEIFDNTERHLETIVKIGEKIGTAT